MSLIPHNTDSFLGKYLKKHGFHQIMISISIESSKIKQY